jgi:hypothetical protein
VEESTSRDRQASEHRAHELKAQYETATQQVLDLRSLWTQQVNDNENLQAAMASMVCEKSFRSLSHLA